MAPVGKLRWRDGRLVVEDPVGGRVLAEVEPDDDMAVDTSGGWFASFRALMGDRSEPRLMVAQWWQAIDEQPPAIDVRAYDTVPEDRQVDRG